MKNYMLNTEMNTALKIILPLEIYQNKVDRKME